jgi:hypothetical protein
VKNISFALTTPQFRARTKRVTRRLGWWSLTPGEHLMAVEKAQGLKKGEHVVQLGEIIVVAVRREKLLLLELDPEYGRQEMALEGFPELKPADFVNRFRTSHHCHPHDFVNRIEYDYA